MKSKIFFLDRETYFIDDRQTNLGGYGVSP